VGEGEKGGGKERRAGKKGVREKRGILPLHACTSFNTTFYTAKSKIKVFST